MRVRIVLALSVPLLAAGGTWLSARAFTPPKKAGAQATNGAPLQLPRTWVPFTATLEVTNDGVLNAGTFRRSSDGSTCAVLETPQLGRTITINNIKRRIFYRYINGRGWFSQPLELKNAEYRPKPTFNAMNDVIKLPQKYEGNFEIYQHCGNGTCSYNLPELNWLTVRTESDYVVQTEMKNIQLGEPGAAFFVPPDGAVVKEIGQSVKVPERNR